MELIKINSSTIGNEVKQTVNARELYSFLGINKDFTTWIKAQIKRARLVENRDYVVFTQKGVNLQGGRPTAEYALTIEAGKHISMMSGSEKGYEVRDYFLECEQKAKNPLAQIADPQTRALIQLLADNDAIKQEQAQHRIMIEDVSNKVDDLTPAHTISILNAIQGAISSAAKWYKAVCNSKHVPINSTESKNHILTMLLDREGVADIGYIRNTSSALQYLRKLASAYQGEYNSWLDRNSLFGRAAQ